MGKNCLEKIEVNENRKKTFTILGYSIWRILAYFIIYSVFGFVVETLYGAMTKGVIESRQSFLYGPFCSIYGLGAVIMIIFLQYFKKNNNTLFWGGFLIGSVTEYLVSLIGELILNVKWWDYSNMPLNIDGRICVFFSIFWGLLAIYLMTYINPKIDRLIEIVKKKFSMKTLKIITMTVIVLLFINCIVTGYAIKVFQLRMVYNHNIDVNMEKSKIEEIYNKIYGNKEKANFIYKYFGDKKMIRTFPNLKIEDANGNMVYLDSLLPDIQPYYYKFQHEVGLNKK